ncbi:Riboflavin synthase eubacterial/eukaryotic [invertebrate metagenome]|uniref:Riboflavin synthase n=1 Tax=invertebrate metagenome TaxID=1711999 RepID=A0A484H6D5_9ZZZZ
MFTGIITDLGSVQRVERSMGDTKFVFYTHYDISSLSTGTSIACCGCCLTVIEYGPSWFSVHVSEETLERTTLKSWKLGTLVNFERALCVGGELGGHIVLGHVDGVAKVADVQSAGESRRLAVTPPTQLTRSVAVKGSVTLDGVSLTVNEVWRDGFSVNIIPYTQSVTTLGLLQPGDCVNMEIDILARYVARLLGKD